MVLFGTVVDTVTKVWGLPGFVMSWYSLMNFEVQILLSLGIARICNVMVPVSFTGGINFGVSGDCPDL